ncbi:unnamed protein product (macronuclear) [Paramecium tetraurelia]|uniref:GRIP domain-containing protein n=1 Tax=Paramecium tetraurelia TaxID=5888 RepID=A0BUF8_PARTE|nr:uncharacterized protein GSPATT00032407001 [Paramecium tetraurelia]CAK62175.1 unnamed protein product [Paramecium tetraurelia]|eukprot:XP_001429573.1 hypothetical protein (macronuclear) [Paramecium tetraurelia strain d4-2]
MDSQIQYKEEMTKIMQILEKTKEKSAHEQDLFKNRMLEKDDILNEAKKQFEQTTKQFENENAALITQLSYDIKLLFYLQANKTLKEQPKKICDLELKIKDLNPNCKKAIDNIQIARTLKQQYTLLSIAKKSIQASSKHQEQLIFNDEELQKSKQLQQRILQDNSYSKLKLESFLQMNSKSKSNELENLKNQILEKDQEIELLKQQQKSMATQLKISQGYATRFKQRNKQLEMENTELLKSKDNLETLFLEILDQTKQNQMQRINSYNFHEIIPYIISALSNNPTKYQMNLLTQRNNYMQENTSTHSQENRSSSQKSNNTTPNKVAKTRDVSFKRTILVSGSKKTTHSVSQENINSKQSNKALNEIQEPDESQQQNKSQSSQEPQEQQILQDQQQSLQQQQEHKEDQIYEDQENNEEVADFIDDDNDLK